MYIYICCPELLYRYNSGRIAELCPYCVCVCVCVCV